MLAGNLQQPAVLFVDDESLSLKLFKSAFSKKFKILTASNANEAGIILDQCGKDISVLVSDERMPGESGVNFLKQVKKNHPNIVRILTTSFTNLENLQESVNSAEVFRFVSKPWNLGALGNDLEAAVDLAEENFKVREQIVVLGRDLIKQRMLMARALDAPLRGMDMSLKEVDDYLSTAAGMDKSLTHIEHLINLRDAFQLFSDSVFDYQKTLSLGELSVLTPMSLAKLSMAECVRMGVENYKFNVGQYRLLELNLKNDFEFMGDPLYMDLVISRLLYSSFSRVGNHEGVIRISLGDRGDSNVLSFRHGIEQISANKRIDRMDLVFAASLEGDSDGLHFCRSVIREFSGNISYSRTTPNSSEFVINLPPLIARKSYSNVQRLH